MSPVLFTLALCSLHRMQRPPHISILSYADDLLIITRAEETSYREAQDYIDSIIQHLEERGLSSNAGKCGFMDLELGRPRRPTSAQAPRIHEQPIPEMNQLRYLGVIIDKRLDWSTHWEKVGRDTRRLVGILWRTLGCEPESFKRAYKGLVESRLSFSLAACPPTRHLDWRAIGFAPALAGRYLTGLWRSDRQEVAAASGIREPGTICFKLSVGLMSKYFRLHKNGQQTPIDFRPSGRAQVQRTCGRIQSSEYAAVQEKHPQEFLRRLGPYRLAALWNGMEIGVACEAIQCQGQLIQRLRSTPALLSRIDRLADTLPPAVRVRLNLPPLNL